MTPLVLFSRLADILHKDLFFDFINTFRGLRAEGKPFWTARILQSARCPMCLMSPSVRRSFPKISDFRVNLEKYFGYS